MIISPYRTIEKSRSKPAFDHTFTPVFDEVVARCGPLAAIVYGMIFRYCQMRERVCFASLDLLSKRSGLSYSTVKRAIAELRDMGLVSDLSPGLRNRPHVYRALPIPDWAEEAANEAQEGLASCALGGEEESEAEVGRSHRLSTRTHRPSGSVTENDLVGPTDLPTRSERPMNHTIRDNPPEDEGRRAAIEIWKGLLECLSWTVNRNVLRKYLHPAQPVAWDGQTLTISVQEEYARDWIEDRLTSTIERALVGVCALPEPRFRVVVEGGGEEH